MRVENLSDLPEHIRKQVEKKLGIHKKKPVSKYRSQKTWVNGLCFDSKKEADYYSELELLLKAGEIKGFCRQPRFPIIDGTKETRATEYVADFIVFKNDGTAEVIDIKGIKTETFKIKEKAFKVKFKINLNLK